MGKPTCKSCRYWKAPKDGDLGDCRRNPPSYRGPEYQWPGTWAEMPGKWPHAKSTGWCGEYRPKEDELGEAFDKFRERMP